MKRAQKDPKIQLALLIGVLIIVLGFIVEFAMLGNKNNEEPATPTGTTE